MSILEFNSSDLEKLQNRYQHYRSLALNLDLTRGKPCSEQLALSDSLDGILNGSYRTGEGIDIRNYGGIDGLPEAKQFVAEIAAVQPQQVLIGGNSSLTLMYQYLAMAYFHGLQGPESAWRNLAKVRFLCPVPGYDRHFSICQHLGIEMVTVPLTGRGPDMDQVERLVRSDPSIKGIWCVPRYSNPTGESYSDEVVERIARLGKLAADDFRVMWDNAYMVHHLTERPHPLANIIKLAGEYGNQNSVVMLGSTSKVTFAGAGMAFMISSPANLQQFINYLGYQTIGPDKVNQLRHVRFLRNSEHLNKHMTRHAEIIKPKFDRVLDLLDEQLGEGYGIS